MIEMQKLKRRIDAGEDIFSLISDRQLESFLKAVARETIDSIDHFVKYYYAVVAWMLEQSRETKEFICREFFLNESEIRYALSFGVMFVGDRSFEGIEVREDDFKGQIC